MGRDSNQLAIIHQVCLPVGIGKPGEWSFMQEIIRDGRGEKVFGVVYSNKGKFAIRFDVNSKKSKNR